MPQPLLSLVVCTRDRAPHLEAMLASVDAGEALEQGAEVVVVDNGSGDDTPTVVERFAGRFAGDVTLVSEPVPGLGRARNTGIAASRAPIVAFTDDDCRLPPGYFAALRAAFDTRMFDWCAGRVLPATQGDAHYGCLTSPVYRAFPPRAFVRPGAVLGANLAFRAALLDRMGGFDPRLGAGTPFPFEDVEACARACHLGAWGAYDPSVVVTHAHGRRAGDLARHRRAADHARGAFYARMALLGRPEYLMGWYRVRRGGDHDHHLGSELRGALAYLGSPRVLSTARPPRRPTDRPVEPRGARVPVPARSPRR